jgi:hypothetical protein
VAAAGDGASRGSDSHRAITYAECVRLIRDYPLPLYLIHQPGQHYPHGTAEAILLPLHDAGFGTDPELAPLLVC